MVVRSNHAPDVKLKGKMKKDSKQEKVGKFGGLYGQAVTAVIRRLGKDGISTAHIRAIMAAKKINVSDTTVSIQAAAGRNKDSDRGEPAPLTQAQVKELVGSAPEPSQKSGQLPKTS